MAKVKQFEKVLEILMDANGGIVTKDDLVKILGKDIVANRIPTYLWEIKAKSKVPVSVVKSGRKVTGYFIADSKANVAEIQEPVACESEEVGKQVA